MKQPSRQNHRNNNRNNNKGGRRSSGGGGGSGGAHSANRVYDSSGPEGKVRGTAQQIIDKYTSLARDAQTSGEGVLAENFFQHAEHYQRILTTIQAAEAEERERRQAAQLAEQERRAEQQARQQPNRPENQESEPSRPDNQLSQNQPSQQRDDAPKPIEPAATPQPLRAAPAVAPVQAAEVAAPISDPAPVVEGPALVETPESKRAEQREGVPRPARRARTRPVVKTEVATAPSDSVEATPEPTVPDAGPDAEMAEAPAKPKRGRPRKTPPPPSPEEAEPAS